jgi:hypothetical protein
MESKWQHLMPISIRDYHFLNNLFDVLVGGFYCAIHFWSVWRGIRMLDLPLGTQLHYHFSIEILCIIVATQFLTHVLINFQKKPKIAKKQ